MRIKAVVFSVLMMVMAAGAVIGADYYVNATTGGAARSADGSRASPWRDLQVALDRAAAGDTIHISEGNYLGTSDRGFLMMQAPVNLRGGYSSDFSTRNVLVHRTMIQPPASSNRTAQSSALLSLGDPNRVGQFRVNGEIVIDGIIFDRGFSNAYSPDRGKPAGVETGMLINPPGQGINGTTQGVTTVQRPLVYIVTGSTGNLTIQNCVFTNSGNYAILGSWVNGKITIKNNVFVANMYAAVEIPGQTGTSANAYQTEIEFSYNTVLFSWARTNDLGDMGYGYRFMTGANTDVHHNIIGCSTLAGLDRTRVDSTAADAARRRTGAEDNAFFLNRRGDLYTAAGGGQMLTVWANQFEDREELYKYERNVQLPGNALVGRVNQAYLEGFISMTYSETTDYDPNSAANQFRRAFGINQVATVTSRVDMFANRYPLEDTLRLFGAVSGVGAQTITN